MAVIGYQVLILAGISLASLLFGKRGMLIMIGASALWTLVLIFTGWLMILQCITIYTSYEISKSILESPNIKKYRENSWVFLTIGVIIIIFLLTRDNNRVSNSFQEQPPVTREIPEVNIPPIQVQENPTSKLLEPKVDSLFRAAPSVSTQKNTLLITPKAETTNSIDPIAVQEILEGARISREKYSNAIRQCGRPYPGDSSSLERWSLCMLENGQ